MDGTTTTIRRDELYEQVWREPVVKVAPRYNLSDVGLRKVCDKLNVPTPTRGYWARIEAGQELPKASLPFNGPSVYRRGRVIRAVGSSLGKEASARVQSMVDESIIRRLQVSIPMTLEECSPITQLIAARRAKAIPDNRGWPRYGAGNLIVVEVSPKYQSRSLLLINALFETLIVAGHYSEDEAGASYLAPVAIGDLRFQFRLREQGSPVTHFAGEAGCDESPLAESTGNLGLYAYLVSARYPAAKLTDGRRVAIEKRISRFVIRLRQLAINRWQQAYSDG